MNRNHWEICDYFFNEKSFYFIFWQGNKKSSKDHGSWLLCDVAPLGTGLDWTVRWTGVPRAQH
jgi:hypothetical protein